eukprot:11956436-Ditylum_brightwellii.AAC.1
MKNSRTAAPLAVSVWPTLTEHIIKGSIYCLISAVAVHSAHVTSASTTWYLLNICIAAFFGLYMAVGEVNFITQRLTRRLPPGHLGYPIIREILLFARIASGSSMQTFLRDAHRKYGSVFATSFLGVTNIVLGSKVDLEWIFASDRKCNTEVAWPPVVATLLGPGAVANQSGKYHRVLRRLLEPYFAPTFVKNYFEAMDKTTMEELESWSSSSPEEGGGYVSSE